MSDSILETVKTMIGPSAIYDVFDTDLVVFINSIFFTLWELGVGPDEPFSITGNSELWSDFLPSGNIEAVKGYMVLKARLQFDPPSNSSLYNGILEQCKEYEWRMNVAVDQGEKNV